MNIIRLKEMYEALGAAGTARKLREAAKEDPTIWDRFSLKEAAIVLCGEQWYRDLEPGMQRLNDGFVPVQEAGEGVDVTAFSNITGQLIFSRIKQGYANEAFIGDQLATTAPTQLSGERIPGIQKLKDGVQVVTPGQSFPRMGVGEDYQDMPETEKRGFIVPVTKEAVFFDRTNLVAKRASQVGEWLGLDREERILKVVMGVTNNYNQRGTASNTYLASLGAVPFNYLNEASGKELVDWTDIDESLQLFAERVDPDTGKPIMIGGTTVLVMPAKLMTARMILTAVEVQTRTASSTQLRNVSNPVAGMFNVVSSALAYQLYAASEATASKRKNHWWHGNFKKAFAYNENWGIMVLQAPQNSHEDFDRDIVLQYKASERGVAAVDDPRYVNHLYAT